MCWLKSWESFDLCRRCRQIRRHHVPVPGPWSLLTVYFIHSCRFSPRTVFYLLTGSHLDLESGAWVDWIATLLPRCHTHSSLNLNFESPSIDYQQMIKVIKARIPNMEQGEAAPWWGPDARGQGASEAGSGRRQEQELGNFPPSPSWR